MEFTIKTKLVKSTFFIEYVDKTNEPIIIKTPMDKLGCDLMGESIKNFINDSISTVSYVSFDFDEEDNQSICVELFNDLDDKPIDIKEFWFEDFYTLL